MPSPFVASPFASAGSLPAPSLQESPFVPAASPFAKAGSQPNPGTAAAQLRSPFDPQIPKPPRSPFEPDPVAGNTGTMSSAPQPGEVADRGGILQPAGSTISSPDGCFSSGLDSHNYPISNITPVESRTEFMMTPSVYIPPGVYPPTLLPNPNVDLFMDLGQLIITDEWLGRGAWGEVCKGLYDGRDVAVKFIHWNGELPELRSLQHELTILSRLKHANILEIYGGSVRPDPEIFLVQELLVGSVGDLMYGKNERPPKKLPLLTVLQIGVDILKGLLYLHNLKIVHRDIKPDNTLLTHDGVAKIGDFGLARFKINTILQTRTIEMGTAAYMAPEIFDLDLGGVTVSVDIYSWGITLWEMVMGERPYSQFNKDHAIMWQVLREMRPVLPEASAAFPPQVMLLIQRCWAQVASDRPTAQEALDELEKIIADGALFVPNACLQDAVLVKQQALKAALASTGNGRLRQHLEDIAEIVEDPSGEEQ